MAKKAKSPYAKYKKTPFKYPGTPLHREGDGIPVTPDNVRRFEARLGIRGGNPQGFVALDEPQETYPPMRARRRAAAGLDPQ